MRALLKSQYGFTLLETLVVLVIFAALTAMAVPQYGKFRAQQEVSQVTQQLRDHLEFARTYAQNYQTTVSVCPVAPNQLNAVQIVCAQNKGASWQAWVVLRADTGEVLQRSTSIPEQIQIDSGQRAAFQFNERGGANDFSNGSIKVSSALLSDTKNTITVAAVGRVR